MIPALIRWSISNRFLVLLAAVILAGAGIYSVKNTPIDALPDLSDVQVIIKTNFPGQAPQGFGSAQAPVASVWKHDSGVFKVG